jgi:hypothetical protein
MNTQNAFFNLSLVFVLLFVLAFKCGNDSEPSAKPTPDNKIQKDSDQLTETMVEQVVTQREERLATGAGGSPDSVTVTFERIDFGTTRTATKQDEFDGVPNGETVYPARVKYTPHRRWENGTKEDPEINYNYDFFVNKYGQWDALGRGPVK